MPYALSDSTAAAVKDLVGDYGGGGTTQPKPGYRHWGFVNMTALSMSGTYLNGKVRLINRTGVGEDLPNPIHVVSTGNNKSRLVKGNTYFAQLVGIDADGVSVWCSLGERIIDDVIIEIGCAHTGTVAPGQMVFDTQIRGFNNATDLYDRYVTTRQTIDL